MGPKSAVGDQGVSQLGEKVPALEDWWGRGPIHTVDSESTWKGLGLHESCFLHRTGYLAVLLFKTDPLYMYNYQSVNVLLHGTNPLT